MRMLYGVLVRGTKYLMTNAALPYLYRLSSELCNLWISFVEMQEELLNVILKFDHFTLYSIDTSSNSALVSLLAY